MSRQQLLAMDVLDLGDSMELKSLANRVGWHFTDEQVGLFFAAGTVYGHFREGAVGRTLIGASAIYPYGTRWASLGIVMVDPAAQRQGIATEMVRHCLAAVGAGTVVPGVAAPAAHSGLFAVSGDSSSPVPAVVLVATQQGFPVYEALGFRVIEQVRRWEFDADAIEQVGEFNGSTSSDVSWVQPLQATTDLPTAIALDEIACGGQRPAVYEALFRIATAGCVQRDEQGVVRGLALAARTTAGFLIGPVIADDAAMAAALVAYLVTKLKRTEMELARCTSPIRIDVPSTQTEFQSQLQVIGFHETRVSPVMMLGAGNLPGDRRKMFAFVDPALG